MTGLPPASPQNPSCGACRGETTGSDDGDFICTDCRLRFDAYTMDATYLDDLDRACGAPCDNDWHGPNRIGPDIGFECRTCALPENHTSMHWTGCKPIEVTA